MGMTVGSQRAPGSRLRLAVAGLTCLTLFSALGCAPKAGSSASEAADRKAFRGGPPPPGEGAEMAEAMRKQRESGIKPPPGAIAPNPRARRQP